MGVEATAGDLLVAEGVEAGAGASRCEVTDVIGIGGAFGDSAGCARAFWEFGPPLEPSIKTKYTSTEVSANIEKTVNLSARMPTMR